MTQIPTSEQLRKIYTQTTTTLKKIAKQKKTKSGFIADVFFGSPINKCAGHGICKLKDSSEDRTNSWAWTPCRTLAYVSLRDEKWIKFQILKITVSDRVRNQQFANNCFRVDCDYDMSPHFDTDTSLVILKGEYPVWEEDNFFILEFLCHR